MFFFGGKIISSHHGRRHRLEQTFGKHMRSAQSLVRFQFLYCPENKRISLYEKINGFPFKKWSRFLGHSGKNWKIMKNVLNIVSEWLVGGMLVDTLLGNISPIPAGTFELYDFPAFSRWDILVPWRVRMNKVRSCFFWSQSVPIERLQSPNPVLNQTTNQI